MNIRLIVFLISSIILLAVFGCSERAADPVTPDPVDRGDVLLVIRQLGSEGYIGLILLESGAINESVATVGNTPTDILYNDGYIYVINSRSNSMYVFELSDQNSLTPIDTIAMGMNKRPYSAVIADNGYMYVSNLTDGTVSLVNLDRGEAQLFIQVGQMPMDLVAVGDKVYVCNADDNTVSVISTLTNLVEETIQVGENPLNMAVDGEGMIHVVCTGNYADIEGEVQVIDPATNEKVLFVNLLGQPEDIVITESGFGYVTNAEDSDNRGQLFRYNMSNGQILNDINRNDAIFVSSDPIRLTTGSNSAVFVSCYNAGVVERIVTDESLQSYSIGMQPSGMLFIDR